MNVGGQPIGIENGRYHFMFPISPQGINVDRRSEMIPIAITRGAHESNSINLLVCSVGNSAFTVASTSCNVLSVNSDTEYRV
mgnify:CR=1 FL=1